MTRELKLCPKANCSGNITLFQCPDPKYPEQRTFYNYSCSCGWKAPFSDNEDGAATSWNTRAVPWNHDMEAGKGEGVILLEFHINGKRRVSTGGWDTHWSGNCWISDAVRIPVGTVPSRWMRLPHEGDGQ